MNKIKYFFVCAILAASFAGSGAVRAACGDDCPGDSECSCSAEAGPCDADCREDEGEACDEARAEDDDEACSIEVRERAAVNLVKMFLRALQDKDYAKAYRALDGEDAKDILEHIRIYLPDLDVSISYDEIEADFRAGGPISARYWEWYKKDIKIQNYKDMDAVNFEARSEDGERFAISSSIPGGFWMVDADNHNHQMAISLPKG